jgi:Ca2+-binding RTX toxin-like protein
LLDHIVPMPDFPGLPSFEGGSGEDGSTDPVYIFLEERPNANAYLNFDASRATAAVWLEGGLKSDSFTGSGHGDVIITGDGDLHYVQAQGGNDRVIGGDGRDFIIAGVNREVDSDLDDDTVWGGGGNDIIQGGGGHDILWADDGSNTFQTHDDLKSVERGDWISGGYGDDFIYGSNAKDVLFGGAGGDNLYGGAGDDLLLGDAHYTSFSGTTSLSWAQGNTYSYVYKPLRPTFLSCFSH